MTHATTCPTGKVSRILGRGNIRRRPLYLCEHCGDWHAFSPSATAGASVSRIRLLRARERDEKRTRRASRRADAEEADE